MTDKLKTAQEQRNCYELKNRKNYLKQCIKEAPDYYADAINELMGDPIADIHQTLDRLLWCYMNDYPDKHDDIEDFQFQLARVRKFIAVMTWY